MAPKAIAHDILLKEKASNVYLTIICLRQHKRWFKKSDLLFCECNLIYKAQFCLPFLLSVCLF